MNLSRYGILSKLFDILSTIDPLGTLHRLTIPPSTNNVCPKTKDALSDNSQTTALAISCGSPMRPIGVFDLRLSISYLLSSATRSSISVSTKPGAIAFILIPDLAYSSALIWSFPAQHVCSRYKLAVGEFLLHRLQKTCLLLLHLQT